MHAYPNRTRQQLTAGKIEISMGMRFLLSGADLSSLMAGATARSTFLHGIKL